MFRRKKLVKVKPLREAEAADFCSCDGFLWKAPWCPKHGNDPRALAVLAKFEQAQRDGDPDKVIVARDARID